MVGDGYNLWRSLVAAGSLWWLMVLGVADYLSVGVLVGLVCGG